MPETRDDAQTPPSPEPVRVAWIAAADSFDRYARVLQPLAVGLIDEVVEVTLLIPASADRRALESVPFDVVTYPPRHWWSPWDGEPVLTELRRRKIELLHALECSVAKLTHRLSRAAGLKYLLSCYSLDDAAHLGDAGRHAGHLLAGSEPLCEALARRLGKADRIHLMRPGVYHERHATCFDDPARSAAVVAGGPLKSFEAFDAVLTCFADLVERRFDCTFFVIGTGPAERRLRRRAEKLRLRQAVTFVGDLPMSQLPDILKGADVYVSPVAQRHIDMQSLLAMAAGVPVLTAGSGANDFLRDGQTATAFAPGGAAELTVKLSALLDDHAGARALAESALQYVHENHSPAVNVTALAHLCRQTVARTATKT